MVGETNDGFFFLNCKGKHQPKLKIGTKRKVTKGERKTDAPPQETKKGVLVEMGDLCW